jgi:2-polyprenyl-6-methoxyphenol hydroxylase-like FAD-dependent oxidoreductase
MNSLHTAYNMHQRTAATYRLGRVVLAGDAAHLTNPTSGFGLMGGCTTHLRGARRLRLLFTARQATKSWIDIQNYEEKSIMR